MSLLEILQLIGYTTGAALHLWMAALLTKRRQNLGKIERVLLLLVLGIGAWHACNLFVVLHALLGLQPERWDQLLRLADTIAVISITFSYSLLLHAHLHLWAKARLRRLTLTEHVRVFLSYIPALFLVIAVPRLWTGPYAPMFEKLSFFVVPFALWATYVLLLVAATDILIVRLSSAVSEKWLMLTLAASFVVIGVLILSVHVLGVGRGTTFGSYLQTLANLGSLLPTALLAYYIYRYRYLELIIRESLVLASFASVVLVVYLYGIRTVGVWLTARYGLRAGAVESLLILAFALIVAPLRRWLEKRFHQLFAREAALYRDVVTRIGAQSGRYQQLPELLHFIAERTARELGLRRVNFLARNGADLGSDQTGIFIKSKVDDPDKWLEKILTHKLVGDSLLIEGEPVLHERNYEIAYALRRDDRMVGLMLIDAAHESLTPDVRAVLEALAGQVAIAIEDCRLVEENVRLERRLAQGERLAALGQMAATIAHEVKNPLSAIKSIAQVMREDEHLCREYARDLDLIVGETDRLSRSVTQLLSFARVAPLAGGTSRADELIRAMVELFRAEANSRGIVVDDDIETHHELEGTRASAIRDALSNLLTNALQATPTGGRISVVARVEEDHLLVSVTDDGAGVAMELQERIWEPFFTTKQRGTGLGLAIVRKRMEEVGGLARLAPQQNGGGARFELRMPLTSA